MNKGNGNKMVRGAALILFACVMTAGLFSMIPLAQAAPPYGGPVDTSATKDLGQGSSITNYSSTLYISYVNETNYTLMLAKTTSFPYNTTGDWTRILVDSTVYCRYYSSIYADRYGINIAYFSGSPNYDLRYAFYSFTTSTWSRYTPDSANSVGWSPSITGDSSGNIYISYIQNTNGYVKMAKTTNHGTSWSIETAASEWASYNSIAVNSTGGIHISYYITGNLDLRYANRTAGGSWNRATVDSANDVGQFNSLKLDSSYIYISYYNATGGDLKWAYKTTSGSTWTKGNVETTNNVGKYTCLAIYNGGPGNRLYISYYDVTNTNLRYAYKQTGTGGSWTCANAWTSPNDIGQYSSCVGCGPSSPSDQRGLQISCYEATNTDLYCKAVSP